MMTARRNLGGDGPDYRHFEPSRERSAQANSAVLRQPSPMSVQDLFNIAARMAETAMELDRKPLAERGPEEAIEATRLRHHAVQAWLYGVAIGPPDDLACWGLLNAAMLSLTLRRPDEAKVLYGRAVKAGEGLEMADGLKTAFADVKARVASYHRDVAAALPSGKAWMAGVVWKPDAKRDDPKALGRPHMYVSPDRKAKKALAETRRADRKAKNIAHAQAQRKGA